MTMPELEDYECAQRGGSGFGPWISVGGKLPVAHLAAGISGTDVNSMMVGIRPFRMFHVKHRDELSRDLWPTEPIPGFDREGRPLDATRRKRGVRHCACGLEMAGTLGDLQRNFGGLEQAPGMRRARLSRESPRDPPHDPRVGPEAERIMDPPRRGGCAFGVRGPAPDGFAQRTFWIRSRLRWPRKHAGSEISVSGCFT